MENGDVLVWLLINLNARFTISRVLYIQLRRNRLRGLFFLVLFTDGLQPASTKGTVYLLDFCRTIYHDGLSNFMAGTRGRTPDLVDQVADGSSA